MAMLLLVVLSTAALLYPALSQPARPELFDESDYSVPYYRGRGEWGDPIERQQKVMDIAHMLKDLEAMKFSSLYPQQGRMGKLVDPLGITLFKNIKRMNGGEKRNFDEIDRSGFNGFVKKNFDEIDRSGFNSLVKKNFDEIDRNGFNGFVKRSVNRFEPSNR